jgi:1-deoxy-D-xylulose-5-phosphate synthase
MEIGCGLDAFSQRYKDRFFDVGIAEEHAATLAAGMAAGGMIPCFAVYSTFLQRAYDNVLHDIALQNLPVKLFIDRAGLAHGDGATHHGIFDVSFLSAIPNLRLYAPACYGTLRAMMKDVMTEDTPCAIRYPNASEDARVATTFYPDGDFASYGVRADFEKGAALDAVIITHGRIVTEALKAKKMLAERGVAVGILLLEQLKPYEKIAAEVAELLPKGEATVLFLEEEVRAGGFGMNLSDALTRRGALRAPFAILAADNGFLSPVAGDNYYAAAGIDAEAVVSAAKKLLDDKGETKC